jgi:hypothetical protein
MTLSRIFVAACIGSCVVFYTSCGPSREEVELKERALQPAASDTVSVLSMRPISDTVGGTIHNFVRTADMKFKTQNVLRTTQAIEDLAKRNGGYVALNDMNSEIVSTNEVKFKADSLKLTKRYITTNSITLKVPARRLDSVIRTITGMAEFIDFNRLRSDDVKTQLLAGRLAVNRYRRYGERVEQKSNGNTGRLDRNLEAERDALEKQQLADEKSIEAFGLVERVNFSTVMLYIYQSPLTTCETMALPPHVEPYEPSFFEKLGTAFLVGFKVIKSAALFVVESWGVVAVLMLLVWFGKKLVAPYFSDRATHPSNKVVADRNIK